MHTAGHDAQNDAFQVTDVLIDCTASCATGDPDTSGFANKLNRLADEFAGS